VRAMCRSRRPIAEGLQSVAFIARQPAVHRPPRDAQSLATSPTVRPSPITARTALYLCSVPLISLMRRSVTNQPK